MNCVHLKKKIVFMKYIKIVYVRAKNELSAQKQWWIQAHVARTMNL